MEEGTKTVTAAVLINARRDTVIETADFDDQG
jgi:hypothetical protein